MIFMSSLNRLDGPLLGFCPSWNNLNAASHLVGGLIRQAA